MSGEIVSIPLSAPPRQADKLSSKDNLLVAWQIDGYINDDNGMEYHFAIHSPAWGWRGYRWNEEFGEPRKILPASQDTIWIYGNNTHLLRLKIRQNGEATITAKPILIDNLLDAHESDCLAEMGNSKIERLHFSKDQKQLSVTYLDGDDIVHWAYFLPDGAIVVHYANRLAVLSPEGDKLHEEKDLSYYNHCPFIIRNDHDYLYYTDDPRKGWGKSNVLKVHREHTGTMRPACFFASLYDEYYIVIEDIGHNVHLYCFSSKSPQRVNHVWEIGGGIWEYSIARHSGMICIAAPTRILGRGNIPILENNGFLAWNPISNTFHVDIPRTTNIQKMFTDRPTTVRIPDIWGQDIRRP